MIKATNELDTVVTIICANQKQMPRRDPLQPYMTIIADAAEAESPVKPSTIASRQVGGRRVLGSRAWLVGASVWLLLDVVGGLGVQWCSSHTEVLKTVLKAHA